MSQSPVASGTLVQSPIQVASPISGGDAVINIDGDCGVEPFGSPSSGSTAVESSPHGSKLPLFYRTTPPSGANARNRKGPRTESWGFQRRTSDLYGSLKRSVSDRLPRVPKSWSSEKTWPEEWTRNIDKHPSGYPRLAAFMESDESFKMYRHFGYIHTRVLLHLQCELADMETRLKVMDERDSQDESSKVFLQSQKRDSKGNPERGILLSEFCVKLKEYDELLLLTQQISTIPHPRPRNFRSLTNYMANEKPLVSRESRFINHGEDFVAPVAQREGGWLDELIERALCQWPCWPTKFFFASPSQRNKTDNPYIHYYDKARISALVRLSITITAAVILIIPVFVLFGTAGRTAGLTKVLIIFLFTLAFAAALALSTQAKRHEIFAATAA
ncbi:MAG: hypothetical protein M1840_006937 [Geoglossum simile]|nr:MAG: hypothetical protein M1840_006937 [Geoglossum simile]